MRIKCTAERITARLVLKADITADYMKAVVQDDLKLQWIVIGFQLIEITSHSALISGGALIGLPSCVAWRVAVQMSEWRIGFLQRILSVERNNLHLYSLQFEEDI